MIVSIGAAISQLFGRRKEYQSPKAHLSDELKDADVAVPGTVAVPGMGTSITVVTITRWLKQIDDRVEKDQPLFEISTDKVDAEIPSPYSGFLNEIRVAEGETVPIGTVVAILGGPLKPKLDPRYAVLKVEPDTTLLDIRAAYRREAALWHPDKLAHLAPELQEHAKTRMVELNEAFASLIKEMSN
jgi:pyruvate/2-oxoglutarate dehydrogenase complex dihydrolipoamide acyltransferase (E2) component